MLIYTGYMDLENFQFVEKEQVLNKLKWLIIAQYTGWVKKQGLSMFWTKFQNFYFVRILGINKIKCDKQN